MTPYIAETAACHLYDGGWRAADYEELMREYDLTKDEADLICEKLAEIEAKQELQ